MGTTPFEKVTNVTRDPGVPGRYRATVTNEWNAPVLPHGGVTSSIALRAISTELGLPVGDLRTLHTMFVGQVSPGELEIDVSVLRRGRSMTQARGILRNVGSEHGHEVTAAVGADRPGFEFTDISPPKVPAPDDCPQFRGPLSMREDVEDGFASFWRQIDCRLAKGHLLGDEYEPETSERVYWYRFLEPPESADGSLQALATLTLCDTMPGAVFERLGPGQPLFFSPSIDLVVHRFGPASDGWVLALNRARHASGGYASLEMSMWDEDERLVAYATQAMLFSFPDGPLSPGRRGPG